MTTSIKVVTAETLQQRVSEIFGKEISENDIAVVDLSAENKLNNSVRLTTINDFKSGIEVMLNREISTSDVAIELSEKPYFNIESTTKEGLCNRLKELGFDLNLSDVAVVSADQLNQVSPKNNTIRPKFGKN